MVPCLQSSGNEESSIWNVSSRKILCDRVCGEWFHLECIDSDPAIRECEVAIPAWSGTTGTDVVGVSVYMSLTLSLSSLWPTLPLWSFSGSLCSWGGPGCCSVCSIDCRAWVLPPFSTSWRRLLVLSWRAVPLVPSCWVTSTSIFRRPPLLKQLPYWGCCLGSVCSSTSVSPQGLTVAHFWITITPLGIWGQWSARCALHWRAWITLLSGSLCVLWAAESLTQEGVRSG